MEEPAVEVFERMLTDPNSTLDEKRCAMEVLELIRSHNSAPVAKPD